MDRDHPAAPHANARYGFIATYIVFAAVMYGMIQAYSLLAPILLSLLLILVITLAVNPVVRRLAKWTGGRRRAIGLSVIAVCALGTLLVWATVGPLNQSISVLTEKLPAYWERLQKPLIKMEQQAVLTEEKLQEEVSAEIASESPEAERIMPGSRPVEPLRRELPQAANASSAPADRDNSLRSSLVGMVQGVFGQITGLAQLATEMAIVLFTVAFGVMFCLMNPRPIFGALFSVVPEVHHDRTRVIMVRIATFMPRWAASVLISMLTIGSLFFLLMWPIFGLFDAIMLGLIATLLSVVPFLGPILTLIPALLLAIGEGGLTPLWVLLAYGFVQALEGNVILPLVMAQGMKMHPVFVIFAMLISVAAFGVLGVLLAAPLVAIAGIVHEEIYRKEFLPAVSDDDLEGLASTALLERD